MRSRSPGKRADVSLQPATSASAMCTSPTGFSGVAAGGSGDAGDADAERRAGAAANSVGQRLRDFGADRAACFDDLRGHVRPGRFQLVAVADHAAQKIRGASRNAREALGQQAAGAAFRRGDGGVVAWSVPRATISSSDCPLG